MLPAGPGKRTFSLTGVDPLVQTEDYWYIQTNCPQMRLDVTDINIRPCLNRGFYVYYQNQGTVVAEDQFIEVKLGAELEYTSATPAPVSVSGNTLLFEHHAAPSPSAGGWKQIKVNATASCDLQIGQQAAPPAAFTQASPCQHPSQWQGAIVTVDGACSVLLTHHI